VSCTGLYLFIPQSILAFSRHEYRGGSNTDYLLRGHHQYLKNVCQPMLQDDAIRAELCVADCRARNLNIASTAAERG